jgi:hypothetical protein
MLSGKHLYTREQLVNNFIKEVLKQMLLHFTRREIHKALGIPYNEISDELKDFILNSVVPELLDLPSNAFRNTDLLIDAILLCSDILEYNEKEFLYYKKYKYYNAEDYETPLEWWENLLCIVKNDKMALINF